MYTESKCLHHHSEQLHQDLI